MAEIINLNKERKARQRAAASAEAAVKRVRSGRTAAERKRDLAAAALVRHATDGARLEDDPPRRRRKPPAEPAGEAPTEG